MAKGTYYYTPKKVRKQGRKDGRDWRWKPWRPFPGWPLWEKQDPIPAPTQQISSQYEETIKSDAIANLNKIAEEWSQKDDKLLHEYCAAKNELDRLTEKNTKETKEYENTVKPLEEALEDFSKFPPRWIPLWLYWAIFGVITVGEGFFNYFVFQQFGEREWQTALMAIAIIVIIPLSSELLGHFLKREQKSSMDKGFIVGAIIITVSLLVSLAVLRENFFEMTMAADQDTGKFPLSPAKLSMILILFNLAIFFILTFLSYAEARKEPEAYRQAKGKYKDLLRESRKQEADVVNLDPAIKKVVERYSRIQAQRISLFKEYQSKAEKERNSWIAYVRIYRHANETARKSNVEIASFKTSPEDTIPIPKKLNALHWECEESVSSEAAG